MAADRIVPCIWLDDQAEAAASFYLAAFPDGRVDAVARYPRSGENPSNQPPGSVLTVDLTLAGQRFTLLNGGPNFKPNPSVSFHVHLPDAAAVDALYAPLGEGGMDLMPLDAYPWSPRFAWLQDRFGVSWQLMARGDATRLTVVPALMFAGPHHGRAREAVAAYAAALPGSRVRRVEDFAEGEGGEVGTVKQAALELMGQPFAAMDGGLGHAFGFDEGVSLQVMCVDQAEVDRIATALAADGGEEGPCGWLRDRFGVWWQVVPEAVGTWMASDDEAARDRVFHALLQMRRLDLAALERAFRAADA
ncbi:MAG: VOC family protein [Trueperaceae bacterium]